jgi:hypothetical protein
LPGHNFATFFTAKLWLSLSPCEVPHTQKMSLFTSLTVLLNKAAIGDAYKRHQNDWISSNLPTLATNQLT